MRAFGGKAVTGAGVGAVGVGLAQGAVGIELAKWFRHCQCWCGSRGVAPDFAEAGDIVGNDGAAGERSFDGAMPSGS